MNLCSCMVRSFHNMPGRPSSYLQEQCTKYGISRTTWTSVTTFWSPTVSTSTSSRIVTPTCACFLSARPSGQTTAWGFPAWLQSRCAAGAGNAQHSIARRFKKTEHTMTIFQEVTQFHIHTVPNLYVYITMVQKTPTSGRFCTKGCKYPRRCWNQATGHLRSNLNDFCEID